MKEERNLKIQSISEKMEKEAVRLLEKYGHTAEKKLEKAEKQNPRNSFFTQTFVGKKISGFWVRRHLRRAQEFFNQKLLEKAEQELQLVMKWDPLFAPAWLLKTKIAFENEQYKETIWFATCALKLDPDCVDALSLRALAELALESHATAVADLIRISERCPERSAPWMNVGLIALQYDKLDQADLYIRRGYELDPTPVNKMALANSCIARKDYEEAETLCRELEKTFWEDLAAGSSDPCETLAQKKALLDKTAETESEQEPFLFCMSVLLGLMISLGKQHKLDEVCETCEEILYFWPENPTAKSCLAEALVQKDELDRALELFNEMMEADPTPDLHWRIGEVLFKKKNYTEALPHLRIAMQEKVHPDIAIRYILFSLCELGNMEEIFRFCSEMISQGQKMPELFHIRGSMNFMQGDLDKALADFQKTVRLAPRNPECWLALAKVLLMKDRLKEAEDAVKRVLQFQPDRLEAGLMYIQLLEMTGRKEEVIRTMQQFVQRIQDPIDHMVMDADLQSRLKNFEEAKNIYDKILELRPSHAVALAGRAKIWQEEENWQNAYDDISLAIQASPMVPVFYFHRAVYAANLRNFQQAIEDCELYMTAEADDLRPMMLLGEIRMEMKQPEAAIVLFQKVLAKDPGNVLALRRCAEVKMTLNLSESALSDLERAIEQAPQDEELQALRVQALLNLNRETEALKLCSDFLERNPESLGIHYTRGSILMRMKQPDEALADFDWICERDREEIQPHMTRAVALNAAFRHEEALKELDYILEIQPDYIPALSEKALIYSIMGETELALELLDQILEQTPDDVNLLNIRGTILANDEEIDEAIEAFQKAVEIQPDFAPSLNNLGHMQMLQGDLEKGLDTLTRAIESNDSWGRPYLNRAMIYMKIQSLEEASRDIEEAMQKAQEAGDEDVLVDAIELRDKLNILIRFVENEKKLEEYEEEIEEEDFGFKFMADEADEDGDDDEDDGDDDEDYDEDYDDDDDDDDDYDSDFDPDFDDDDYDEDDSRTELKKGFTLESFLRFALPSVNIKRLSRAEKWALFGRAIRAYLRIIASGQDEKKPQDASNDGDNDIPFGEDTGDDLLNLDEDSEDFDFSVDADNEFASLTSDFMEVEDFLNFEVPIRSNVGKNLWPKFDRVDKEEEDDPMNEDVPEDEGPDSRMEMTLTYLDLSDDDCLQEKDPVKPAQIQNASDFLEHVFQVWSSGMMEEPPENEEEEEDYKQEEQGDFEIVPPIIINCPEMFQKRPEDSGDPQELAVPEGFNFMIQMASYISYKKDRQFFFEQLLEISEILDRNFKETKDPNYRELLLRHKWSFECLMKLIMEKLLNRDNEILLVITNFLTNRIMNRLSGK